MKISDSNPIQFWAAGRTPFNDVDIWGIDKKLFYQSVKVSDHHRTDVKFDKAAAPTWDVVITYSIGDLVYSALTGLRYVSLIDSNVGNDPTVTLGTDWDLEDVTASYSGATNYSIGNRVKAFDRRSELFTNTDFNGNITGWDGNYNLAASSGLETWAYDAGSGGAKVVASFNYVSTRGLKQTITPSLNSKYSIRVKGSVVCSSYPSNIVVLVHFFDAAGGFVGVTQVYTTPANGAFDVTAEVTWANVGRIALQFTQAGGASSISSGVFIVDIFSCFGVDVTKVFESLDNGNIGNEPYLNIGTLWKIVVQDQSIYKMLAYIGDVYNQEFVFKNVRAGVPNQFVEFDYSVFPALVNAFLKLKIVSTSDVSIILASSDCIDIQNDYNSSLLIEYTNLADYDNIAYRDTHPVNKLRIQPAHFWEHQDPREEEDYADSKGDVITLKTKIEKQQKLSVSYFPAFMHTKLAHIFNHDFIRIDGVVYKGRVAYAPVPIERSTLYAGSVWLTEQGSVLVNIGGEIIDVEGRIFDDTFGREFP